MAIVGGPGVGLVATTGAGGDFAFDLRLPGDSTIALEGRKDDYEPQRHDVFIGGYTRDGRCNRYTSIELGPQPHALWAYVQQAGPAGGRRIAGARVEVLDGPNVGVSAVTGPDGLFALTQLATSPRYEIRYSGDGYATRIAALDGLTRNTRVDLGLLPE